MVRRDGIERLFGKGLARPARLLGDQNRTIVRLWLNRTSVRIVEYGTEAHKRVSELIRAVIIGTDRCHYRSASRTLVRIVSPRTRCDCLQIPNKIQTAPQAPVS